MELIDSTQLCFTKDRREKGEREREREREIQGPGRRGAPYLQGVQPPPVQKDGETDEVAVLGHHLCGWNDDSEQVIYTQADRKAATGRGGKYPSTFSRNCTRVEI